MIPRPIKALWAWLCRRVAQALDWVLEQALDHIGEPMAWEDVERLAQTRMEQERREAEKRWRTVQETKPVLRLVSKP